MRSKPRFVSFVVVLMVLVIFSGCSSPTSPTAPPPTGDFTLTANVVGDGAPVAGAEIDLYYGSSGSKVGQAVSGEDGRAMFTGLGSGPHQLNLIEVFGFRTPVLKNVTVEGDTAVDLQLEPVDDAALDCIQQSGGPCLEDGATLYWPMYDVRFSGRVKAVSYPLESLRVSVGVGKLSGTVTHKIPVTSLDDALQLVFGARSQGIVPGGEWYYVLGTEDNPSLPCTNPQENGVAIPLNEATEVWCYSQVTYSGTQVRTSGSATPIAESGESTFTFNLVRR